MQRRKWHFRGRFAKSILEVLLEKNASSVERYHSPPFSDLSIFSPKGKGRFERLFDRHLVLCVGFSARNCGELMKMGGKAVFLT
jgi:hypothetical protein